MSDISDAVIADAHAASPAISRKQRIDRRILRCAVARAWLVAQTRSTPTGAIFGSSPSGSPRHGTPSLDTAGEADLNAYSAVRQKDKSTSANRRLSVFRRYYAWAVREHRAAADPTLRIRSAKQPPRFPSTLTEAQVEALLGAPNIDTPLGLRDRTMLELMYASGLRVTELVTLKTVEVGLNDGVVRVMGKGSKERLIPFGEGGARLDRAISARRAARVARRAFDRCALRHGARRRHDAAQFWNIIKRHAARPPTCMRRCRRTRCGTRSRRIC